MLENDLVGVGADPTNLSLGSPSLKPRARAAAINESIPWPVRCLLWSLADMVTNPRHVRFTPKSGHVQRLYQRPLSAKSRNCEPAQEGPNERSVMPRQ